MTEVERQRLFLERAALFSRACPAVEEVVQERIYRKLGRVYLEKDDPLQTLR